MPPFSMTFGYVIFEKLGQLKPSEPSALREAKSSSHKL
jgi:hypothetical protein